MKVVREKKKLIVLITVIVIAILIGVGVAVNATGSESGMAKSMTFTENMDGYYVYFRAVDEAGNVGDWSNAQRVWIDTTSPSISAKQDSVEVEEGKSNDLETYFDIEANGKSEISNITFVDKSDGDKVVENTSELAVGSHEIEATVEKANGVKASASVIIVIAVAGFTLTFIANGSTYATITEAKTVEFPEQNPTLTGSTFTGWYYDESRTQKANVGEKVTQDINLYAGWQSYIMNKFSEHNPDGYTIFLAQNHYDYTWRYNGDSGSRVEEPLIIHSYEGSSTIEYIEIDMNRTTINADSRLGLSTDVFTTNGNSVIIDLKILPQYGEVIESTFIVTGIVGVNVHFSDGSIDTDEITITSMKLNYQCLVAGTQITLADKTTKVIEEITYEDELLVWDFDNAKFTTTKPLWIQKVKTSPNYNLLKFNNGAELKTINQHRIFNKDTGKFTYPMTDDTPIGTTTFTHDGTETKLISKEVIQEKVDYYNIITDYHINLFANGILTSCRLSNLYPIQDMKYIKDNRPLATKEEYPDIPEEYFKGLRIAEQPRDINRDGNVKFSDDLNGYVKNLINNAEPRED